jgi:hypothetical protein
MNTAYASLTVVVVTWLLYAVVPIYLIYRGWPLRAGLAMLLVALLPLTWQGVFTDSDAKGFGILLAVMLPFPLLIIAWGLIAAILRGVRRLRARTA